MGKLKTKVDAVKIKSRMLVTEAGKSSAKERRDDSWAVGITKFRCAVTHRT